MNKIKWHWQTESNRNTLPLVDDLLAALITLAFQTSGESHDEAGIPYEKNNHE